jgi:hypothetical protein
VQYEEIFHVGILAAALTFASAFHHHHFPRRQCCHQRLDHSDRISASSTEESCSILALAIYLYCIRDALQQDAVSFLHKLHPEARDACSTKAQIDYHYICERSQK